MKRKRMCVCVCEGTVGERGGGDRLVSTRQGAAIKISPGLSQSLSPLLKTKSDGMLDNERKKKDRERKMESERNSSVEAPQRVCCLSPTVQCGSLALSAYSKRVCGGAGVCVRVCVFLHRCP